MTFQEIFESEGFYVADDFRNGSCLEIKGEDRVLYFNSYNIHKGTRNTHKMPMAVFKGLFEKTYRKVNSEEEFFVELENK